MIPLIPLAEFAKRKLVIQKDYEKAKQACEALERQASKPHLSVIRRIVEEKRIQESKIEQLMNDMKWAGGQVVLHWPIEKMAAQMTILEASLFSRVEVRFDLKTRRVSDLQYAFSMQTTLSLKACLDFHFFIERMIIDQILIQSESHRSSAISYFIQVAFLCFYVHQNTSTTCAILKALASPEILRLEKTWPFVKSKELHRHLVKTLPDLQAPFSEHAQLVEQMVLHHSNSKLGAITVIPYLLPFLEELARIEQVYSVSDTLLSETGAKCQDDIMLLLECCQGICRREVLVYSDESSSSAPSKPTHPRHIWDQAMKRPLPVLSQDVSLMKSDLKLEFWILTRVFWSRMDLWNKSMECESLKPKETVPSLLENNIIIMESVLETKNAYV